MTPAFDLEFRQFADDPSTDELSAALLVNLLLDPAIDRCALRVKADALADACPDEVRPWTFLQRQGFGGIPGAPVSLSHSCMSDVLNTGRGIPISLGVLLVHVARRRGLDAKGINFPGRFLARVDDHLVDPLTFQPITEQACLQQLTGAPLRDPFAVATSAMIALRMLNNVKAQWLDAAQWDRAMGAISYQLMLLPRNAELLFERGQVWEMLGALDAARQSYAEVVECAVDPELRETAGRKLKDRAGNETVWH